MRSTIEKLRKTLPEFIPIKRYCKLRNRCRASAYNDIRRVVGLAVKIGPRTFIVRDVALDEMARTLAPLPWISQKNRIAAPATVATLKQSTRGKEPAAPPREHDPEVRS